MAMDASEILKKARAKAGNSSAKEDKPMEKGGGCMASEMKKEMAELCEKVDKILEILGAAAGEEDGDDGPDYAAKPGDKGSEKKNDFQ